MDAEQIRERIRIVCPEFAYLDTQVSAAFFHRAAGLNVTTNELEETLIALVTDRMQKLTAEALLDSLIARRRRPRRLVGGVVL
jgi:hypothetical protein